MLSYVSFILFMKSKTNGTHLHSVPLLMLQARSFRKHLLTEQKQSTLNGNQKSKIRQHIAFSFPEIIHFTDYDVCYAHPPAVDSTVSGASASTTPFVSV